MNKLILIFCMALISCDNVPQRPLIVTGYKTSSIDAFSCQRSYCVVDQANVYYYFTDIVDCTKPSSYMVGDTLKSLH